MDFYRELGDTFGIPLQAHNRWGGFKSLRARWTEHISTTLSRPVLIIDEAQEAHNTVRTELRVLASKDLDSRQLLCVVLAGDGRLVERLRSPDFLPLGTRIRRRLVLEYAPRDELLASLDHLLEAAGNPSLMTTELKATLADHAAGNYRVLMNLADELLVSAVDRDLPPLNLALADAHQRGASLLSPSRMSWISAAELAALPFFSKSRSRRPSRPGPRRHAPPSRPLRSALPPFGSGRKQVQP